MGPLGLRRNREEPREKLPISPLTFYYPPHSAPKDEVSPTVCRVSKNNLPILKSCKTLTLAVTYWLCLPLPGSAHPVYIAS